MGIQPIDLQTLYLQMDKVGKQQGAEQKAKEEAIFEQGEKAKAEQLRKENSVQELQEYDKIDVNKDGHRSNDFGSKKAKSKTEEIIEDEADEKKEDFFTDPDLGRKIDFSG